MRTSTAALSLAPIWLPERRSVIAKAIGFDPSSLWTIFLATFIFTALWAADVAFAQIGLQPDVAHPAVIATGDGKLEVFVRGMGNDLVQRSWNGATWSGWKNLGGDITAAPAVTSSRPGRLDVFVRGMTGNLVHRIFENGQWSGWNDLGGDLTEAPAAVSPQAGRIDVFVRGMNGNLVQRTFRNGNWSGWLDLGGFLSSAPAAVALGPNRIEVFARDAQFHLVQRSYDGSGWSDEKPLGGDLTAAPAAAATGPSNVHVLVRGMSGELVQRVWNGTSWTGWINLGGSLSSAPTVAADPAGRLEVFVRGTNDDLVQRSFNGDVWSGWKNLGGDLRGKLRARLRLLTHNVYGVNKAHCKTRARTFGGTVAAATRPYDIVALQEYYNVPDFDIGTCDAGPLSESIWSTGRYKNSNNYYRFYPEVSLKPDGGVGLFTLHPIRKFDYWQWSNDAQGFPKSAEGFIFARIEIPYTGVQVDTYVVHLNSGDDRPRRKKQLEQLAGRIRELSRASANPVLVLGDFNIGGPPSNHGNAGYEDIMSVLRHPQDLWVRTRPRDEGYSFDCARNSVAAMSDDCDYRERIDYIFVVTDPYFTDNDFLVTVLKKNEMNVVEWSFLNHTGGQSSRVHVSDHFGLEALIEIRER